jgi:hypothetical protein
MSPLKVERDNELVGIIQGVGCLDLTNPVNILNFGGRVTYWGDQMGQVSFISPEGTEIFHK